MPIVVGGTNYYIEALLWHVLVDREKGGEEEVERFRKALCHDLSDEALAGLSNERAHELLRVVDPGRAACLHENDRRKVLRSLQVFWQNGRPHSAILEVLKQNV